MYTVVALVVVLISLAIYHGMKKPPNFPPGLPKLPILGSVTYLSPNLFEVIKQLHKKHGGIFGFFLGSNPLVVVADYELYKESMASDVFINRPSTGANDEFMFPDENGNRAGIMFSKGKEWQEQRRFSLHQLRDFGFGNVKMEPAIIKEMQKCVEMIAETCGRTTSLKLKLNISILNALWHILTGEKIAYDDPKCKDIVHKFYLMMATTNSVGSLVLFPWLKNIAPDLLGYTTIKNARQACDALVEDIYNDHIKTFDPNNLRDFIDAYINKMNNEKENPKSSFHGKRGKENLLDVMTNLFVGGSETTSNTINYVIWYMCKHPELQRKIHDQIDSTIGRDRLPSIMDKKNTAYLEAVTYEAQRITGLAFAGIPRVSDRPSKLGGYDIPKGTRLFFALYEIMRDPKYFEDPTSFKPERFLDDEGNFKMHPQFCAFGIGKRNCLGQTLALTELYLFLCGLMQRFEFKFADGYNPDKIDHEVGLILTCPDYPIIVNERK